MPQLTQLPLIFASQLFWLALVFGIIFFGVGRGMLSKVRSTMLLRERRMADDVEKATKVRAAAAETEAEWRARFETTRREATQIINQAKQESARQTEARVEEALRDIDAKVERARLRIRAAVHAASVEIQTGTADAAQQMVERLIGLRIDREDAAEAVAAELEGLGRGVSQGPPPQGAYELQPSCSSLK